jgi:hypothetical protein
MMGKVLGVGTGVAAVAARPIAVAVGLIGVLVVVALCWTIKNADRTDNLVSVIHALHGPGPAAAPSPDDRDGDDVVEGQRTKVKRWRRWVDRAVGRRER